MPRNFEVKTIFRAVDKTSKVLGKIQTRIGRFANKASRSLKKISRVSDKITGGIKKVGFAVAGAAGAAALAVGGLMKQFSKIEDAQASFHPILGGAEKAKDMVDALNKTAATTPFQFETLAGAAKQLLPNLNGNIEETIKLTRMLGDTAGGNAQKMDSIVRGYNKSLLKGKVDMESLNMIAEAGVPIFQDLGKVIGKTGEDMFKSISAGEVSTEQLTASFQRMTSKGGMFYKGMEVASETLSGKVSTLKDNVGLAAAELGSTMAPTLKELTDYLIIVAKKAQDWIKANKELIRTKVVEFVKKIPPYLEKIAYWAPRIAKLVAVFYAITTAIKVATVAMEIFSFVSNIKLGPLKKMASFMSKDMAAAIGKSTAATKAGTAATGGLTKAFGALGAFAAGWAIGDTIREKLVDPLIEAQFQLGELINDVADTMGRDVSKRGSAQIRKDLEAVEKTRKALDKDFVLSNLPGMGFFKDMGTLGLNKEEGRLKGALAAAGPSPVRPSVNISQSSSESVEKSEVTIKDETGRAKQTKGKQGRGFKLVHSGAMP